MNHTTDPDDPDSHIRKTQSFTNRQIGIGGGVIAALLAIQPLSQMYLTNDKADTLRTEISTIKNVQIEVKQSIKDNKTELMSAIKEGNRTVIDTLKEAEPRMIKAQDKLEAEVERQQSRLDTLEASLNNKRNQKQN